MKGKKSGLCRWGCGKKADNHSGICDLCWTNRVEIAAKRYLDEAIKPKRVLSEATKTKMKAYHKARSDAKLANKATLGQKGG